MFERMGGKDGVALFDVGLDHLLQSEVLEEPVHGGDVVVVLVLRRLLRFRLDQDGAVNPILQA